MDEVSEKILTYLSNVDKASNKEIAKELRINSGLISRKIKELQDKGLIRVVEQEGRTKYYALARPFQGVSEYDENHVIIPKDITTITGIRAFIRGALNQNNWHSTSYDLPLMALLISKYTNLRLIVFGSQYVGKTTCIKGSVQHGHL